MRAGTRVTIQDVARVAGVAVSTVSRVLNQSDYASEPTRERVIDAATRLNYRANPAARGLRRAQTMTIGVVLSDLANPIYTEFIRGAEHRAYASGYALLIADGQNSEEIQALMLQNLYNRRVDALILRGPVVVGRSLDPYLADGIAIYPGAIEGEHGVELREPRDETAASLEAFRHLTGLGHRRIVFVSRMGNNRSDRFQLLSDVMREAGLPTAAATHHHLDGFEEAAALVQSLQRARDLPTAFVAGAHIVAPYLLAAIRDAALRIPQDVSFICYGDSPWAAAHSPPISAVRFDYYRDGHQAVEMVLRSLEGESASEVWERIPAVFVNRGSCAPAPRSL